ncbi:MAG TPA: S41 family peptidase [Holophagaceae bacterium]|nr:S41 family peptidase [Holophagaceae bacterium]
MHARTWLATFSLPLVAVFTYPVLKRQSSPPKSSSKAPVQDPLAGLTDIEDVMSLVQSNYVDRPDMDKVIGGGIQAALERAHPLNAFLGPEDLRASDPGPAETGLVLLKRGLYASVLAVVPGSPAAKAGLQPGDVVRKIDGESVGQLSAWAMERRLRGAEGSKVELVDYSSATGDPGKITLVRTVLKPAGVSLRKGDAANLVVLPDLRKGRAEELKKAVEGLDRAKPLVLDLRQNAKGDLAEAGAVAGLFLKSGTLVTVQEQGQADKAVPFLGSGLPAFSQIVVLQNGSTLGAAEALSACLKKGGAALVGEKTIGLGVELSRMPLRQGGAVDLVTRRWLGAGGEKLDRQGVAPTKALKLAADEDPLPKVMAALKPDPKDAPKTAAKPADTHA